MIYVTEILTVLLVYCIFWSEEDQLLKHLLMFCFFVFFICQIYSVHPGDLFFSSH